MLPPTPNLLPRTNDHFSTDKASVYVKNLKPGMLRIRMSHWRHAMVDGAKFWISYHWLAFLSHLSCWKLIQNLVPSTIVWRQCDIQIYFYLNRKYSELTTAKLTTKVSLYNQKKKSDYITNIYKPNFTKLFSSSRALLAL